MLVAAEVQPQRHQQPGVPEVHRHHVQREAQHLKNCTNQNGAGTARRRLIDQHCSFHHFTSAVSIPSEHARRAAAD